MCIVHAKHAPYTNRWVSFVENRKISNFRSFKTKVIQKNSAGILS